MQTEDLARVSEDWVQGIPWQLLVTAIVKICVILLLAWGSYRLLRVVLRRIERSAAGAHPGPVTAQEQRLTTLLSLVKSAGLAVIAVITLFMVLSAVGLEIGPLLAGAGVVGLAISFGAQSLVRDIISGLFILLENQFGVGDVIRVGDVSGTVEKMTLRIVTMRDVQGIVHIVPNGEITRVSNLTRAFSRALVEIGIAYKEDVDYVMETMREVGRELYADPAWKPVMIEEPTVPGIESFGDSAVMVRMLATTLPLKQWEVARELRRRLKKRFDELGIAIPFPHKTVYHSGDVNPG